MESTYGRSVSASVVLGCVGIISMREGGSNSYVNRLLVYILIVGPTLAFILILSPCIL